MAQFVIPTIFTAVDRLTGPVLRMQKAMQGLSTISGVQGAKLQRSLQETSTAAMDTAYSAGLIGAAIVLPLGLATHAAVKFEKEMTNVATLMDTSKESVQEFSDAVLKMASNTPVAMNDLTEALYQIRSEGYKGAQALDILKQSANLSVAGLSTATEAAMSVASAMRVFADENMTANQISDLFFKTVAVGRTKMAAINESFGSTAAIIHEGGVSMREMMAATAAMTNSGMTASESMVALRQSIVAMIKPSGEMENVFRALGVADGRELVAKMGGVVPAMKAIGDASKKFGLNVADAFGRVQGLVAYTLLTGSLSEQYRLDMKRMSDGINEVDDAYAKQLGTTSAQVQIAKNNLMILGVTLGTVFLPALTAAAKMLVAVVTPITNFAREHKTLTKWVLGSVMAIGAFTLGLSAVSFVIGTVTKATWLWNTAIGAFNFVQGIALGITGNFNAVLLSSKAAWYGYTTFTYAATAATNYFGTALTGIIAKVSILTAGFALIYQYRKEIQNWANDSQLGIGWNNWINDKKALKETFERQYAADPQRTMRYVTNKKHDFYSDTAFGLKEAFAKIDRGEKLNDDNDLTFQQKKFERMANGGQDVAQGTVNPTINMTLNVDKSGNASIVADTAGNAIPINFFQTNQYKH